MVERFFSIQYQNQPGIFTNLAISKDLDMMKEQGTYPLISLSLGGITAPNYEDMLKSLSQLIRDIFSKISKTLGFDHMEPRDIEYIKRLLNERYDDNDEVIPLSENTLKLCLNRLCSILNTKYNKNVIILLDEYDSPLENAYLQGYWDKAAEFFGQFFKNTFKFNTNLERALVIGINMIPKESLNSPFNNPDPCSVTDSSYGDVFGFTQKEVDDALSEYQMLDLREKVKWWYDGYQFGKQKDMYNPWSICFMIANGEFEAYWWGSASNKIVSHVIKNGSMNLKDQFVNLLQEREIAVKVSKEVTYDVLLDTENSIWAMLLSCGYIKPIERKDEDTYVVAIVNHEVMKMMDMLVLS